MRRPGPQGSGGTGRAGRAADGRGHPEPTPPVRTVADAVAALQRPDDRAAGPRRADVRTARGGDDAPVRANRTPRAADGSPGHGRRPAHGGDGAPDRDGRAPRGGGRTRGGPATATRKRPSRNAAGATEPAAARGSRPSPHHLRRRRTALVVVVLALLGGLAAGAWALLFASGLADVEDVRVSGTLTISRDDVLRAAAVTVGAPLAGVDTDGAERRIAALPGVGSVEVGRDWPHTVVVTVTERVPVALADTPKGLMLVDATGLPYRVAPEVPPVLPKIDVGIAGTVAAGDPQTMAGLGVLAALPELVRNQVQTVTVVAPVAPGAQPAVELTLSGDRRVVWGSPTAEARKAAVLTALLTEKGTVYDVASPDLPTVRR